MADDKGKDVDRGSLDLPEPQGDPPVLELPPEPSGAPAGASSERRNAGRVHRRPRTAEANAPEENNNPEENN